MRRLFLWLGVLILLAGCKVIPEDFTPQPAPTQAVPTVAAPLPTQAPTENLPVVNEPTPTELPTPVPTQIPPTETPTETFEPTPVFIYRPMHTAPLFIANFAYPDQACNWLGIGGQVLKANGDPAPGLVINVQGNLDGQAVNVMSYTGAAQIYGPAGYELKLGDRPGNGIFWVDLYDMQGNHLSDTFAFSTSASCEANLAVLNFVEAGYTVASLPIIRK